MWKLAEMVRLNLTGSSFCPDAFGEAELVRNIKATEVMVYSGGHKIDFASRAQYDDKR